MPGTERARRLTVMAGAAALAVGLVSCHGATPAPTSSTSSMSVGGAPIRVNGLRPRQPLYPGEAQDPGSVQLLQLLFRGLVRYDAHGKVVNEVARSITSTDNRTWRIRLKSGWKFTNGEPVTASSFVDAWNYTALVVNHQANATFFAPIQGYADVHPARAGAAPRAKTMSGLEVTGDLSFTVRLREPDPSFPRRLGALAFSPLPTAAFKDKPAFGRHPVGNGPYQLSPERQSSDGVVLQANSSFKGRDAARNSGLRITFYDKPSQAYQDLRDGALDVLDGIPSDRLGSFAKDLGDRAINQPAGSLESLSFPLDRPPWNGPHGAQLRRAISMAIDRRTITAETLHGTATPATDFSAPVVPGWSDTLCGQTCELRPDPARRLWRAAGGLGGRLQIAYAADGGQGPWVQAICADLHEVLRVRCEGRPYRDAAAYRKAVNGGDLRTPFVAGWRMDYPGLENFLLPRFTVDGGADHTGYHSARFDAAVATARRAPDGGSRIEALRTAEEVLVQDLPTIPLWYPRATGGYGPDVAGVVFGADGFPVYTDITRPSPDSAAG